MKQTTNEALAAILAEVQGINKRLDRINGKIEEHEKKLADHQVQLALLQRGQCASESRWTQVWEVIKPVVIALVTAGVLMAAKGAP